MKVSIIEPVGGHGGMDYYDYGLAYGLGENEVLVHFYTSDRTNIREFKNVETQIFFKDVWGSNFLKKTWLYIKGHCRAYLDSKKNNVNIVHLHFFFFRSIDLLIILLAKLFRLKIVVTVHDVNSFHKRNSKRIEKLCYRLIDGVVVHNKSSFETITKKSIKTNRVIIIPHGNYLPFITPVTARNKTSASFKLLFFGQIKDVKGIDVLIKAIAHVVKVDQNISVLIAGRAWKNDVNIYNSLIDQLGLAEFIKTDFNYVPDVAMAQLFQETDLVVLPYKEIYQSGVLLLTMSYGRPLLCSDLEPFLEIITDKKTGFVFKSEDDKDLANKILEIMHKPDLLSRVSANAFKIVNSDFDWVKIGKKTLEFYKEIIKI